MSIAVVSTLASAPAPVVAIPAEGTTNGASAALAAASGRDFASILSTLPTPADARLRLDTERLPALPATATDPSVPGETAPGLDLDTMLLGLPVAAAQAAPDTKVPAEQDPDPAEASSAATEPWLPAIVGVNLPPAVKGAESRPDLAAASARPARQETSMATTAARLAPPPVEPQTTAGNNRQPPALGSAATDERPASFAAAAIAAATVEQTVPASVPKGLDLSTPTSNPAIVAPSAMHVPSVPTSANKLPESLPTPLRDASWASDLGQKLLWFVNNEKQGAQLSLNPPQLGSIEVTVNMDRSNANAHFASANAEVRGAIEAAVPRLREMFASAGIDLGQVSVGSESFRQQSDGRQEASHQPRALADTAILGVGSGGGAPGQSAVMRRGSALVDTFA